MPAHLIELAKTSNILDVAERRGALLKRVNAREWAGPCPVCGCTDRFSINTRKGVFNCRGCGAAGDTIALTQHFDGCDFREAVERLSGRAIEVASGRQTGGSTYSRRHGRDRRAAEATWNEALPIAGSDGEAYLVKRGIILDDVPDHGGLRWHPRCPWEGGTAPCLVARFTDSITVEPRGIWRRRPIPGAKPKSLGPNAGCVIRLWPDDAVELGLVLGEGVETTLSAATRIIHKGTYLRPAWAAGSTANMASLPALPGVESLTLLVDHDENAAGERAADQCRTPLARRRPRSHPPHARRPRRLQRLGETMIERSDRFISSDRLNITEEVKKGKEHAEAGNEGEKKSNGTRRPKRAPSFASFLPLNDMVKDEARGSCRQRRQCPRHFSGRFGRSRLFRV